MEPPEPSSKPSNLADQDLSGVLKRIMDWRYSTRRNTEARRRLANDAITRELLEAGVRLINREFRPEHPEGDQAGEASSYFDWLSTSKVVHEVAQSGRFRATEAQMRDRWKYRDHYIDDLLAYALWDHHWQMQQDTARMARADLQTGVDLAESIRRVAYDDHCAMLDNRSYRVSLLASALTEQSPILEDAFRNIYQYIAEIWSTTYRDVLVARGLKFRPGVSVESFTLMLTAVADGVAMRSLFDKSPELIDHEQARSLIGIAAMAITAACVDPGDGQTLEQIVNSVSRSEAPQEEQ